MKLSKILGTILTFSFALALGIGAVHAIGDAATLADTTNTAVSTGGSFTADLLDPGDRPQEALTSPFRQALVGIVNYILTFLGLVAVGFIVYAGVLMVIDAGGEDNVGKAKNIILWASVGIIIVLLSYAIVRAVTDVKTSIA